jgi:hypothetical protein
VENEGGDADRRLHPVEDGRPTASADARLDALVDAALLLAARAGGAAFGPPPSAGGKA